MTRACRDLFEDIFLGARCSATSDNVDIAIWSGKERKSMHPANKQASFAPESPWFAEPPGPHVHASAIPISTSDTPDVKPCHPSSQNSAVSLYKLLHWHLRRST